MIYKLSAQYKKSVYDVENWFKEENGKKMWIERETGWRWGHCTFESEEHPDIDLKNEYGFMTEDVDIIDYEADDGCWSDTRYSDNIDEEYREILEEMDTDELEEDGWRLNHVDTYFTGPLELEDENGNIWKGEE